MIAPQSDLANRRKSCLAAIGGCLLAILGFKILLIARLGSPTPFWDKWAEATSLYLPYLSHTLTLDHLIAFHNEHRLLLTRASALGLFVLNGTWDPILQMLLDALVHVAAIGCLLVALGRTLDQERLIFLLALALLFCAVPFGWDNTLSGFHGFYFLLLLSLLSLAFLSRAQAWSAEWLTGTFLAVLGYFSTASGSLILPSAIAVAVVQIGFGQRRSAGEIAGIALHMALAAFVIHDLLAYAPRTATPDASARLLYSSLMISASWPIAARSWPVSLQIVPAALVYGPMLILTARLLRQRPAITDRRWYYIALAAWLALQLIALSYARAGGTIQSRYTDIFVIGVMLNFAALLYLAGARTDPKPHKVLRYGAAVWMFAVVLGAGQKAVGNVIDDASFRYASGQRQTENLKTFLATNDFAVLDNKPTFDIPFPDPQTLRELMSNPALRAVLPLELMDVEPNRPLRDAILSQGPMGIPLGLALLLLSAMTSLWRSKREGSREA